MKKALIAANLGGFASFLISDMEILKSMGYEIHYMANCNVLPWDDTKEKLKKLNVKIINVDIDSKNPYKISNIREYRLIKKILKNEKYDLIHCHTPIIGMLIRLASKKMRKTCKVIYTTHGFTFNSNSSRKKWLFYYYLEKKCSKYCDAIITINKEDFNNAKSMKCKNIYYINGVGVDTKRYNIKIKNKSEYRKSLGVEDRDIMILSVGELSDRKNHRIIIEAISLLDNKNDYIYVICGNGINGGVGEELSELASKLGVRLILLGYRHDIPEIMNCSDIGAIPSVREGLGLAGIQSLAAGIPLVASNVQGIKDYVVEGKTGYLSNPFDAQSFAYNLKKLENKDTRKKMRNACVEMSKKFDISKSEQQRKKIYEELLKGVNVCE